MEASFHCKVCNTDRSWFEGHRDYVDTSDKKDGSVLTMACKICCEKDENRFWFVLDYDTLNHLFNQALDTYKWNESTVFLTNDEAQELVKTCLCSIHKGVEEKAREMYLNKYKLLGRQLKN